MLTPFAEAYQLGKRGYSGPEHMHTVSYLRRIGLEVDVDEFDEDGNSAGIPHLTVARSVNKPSANTVTRRRR